MSYTPGIISAPRLNDTGLTPRIHKDGGGGKGDSNSTEEEAQLPHKHMKRCSASLATKESLSCPHWHKF